MLLPKCNPQIMRRAPDLHDSLAVHWRFGDRSVHDARRDLRVPIALQTAVVDVRASDDGQAVVGDEELAVDVDLLSAHFAVQQIAGAQVQ